MNPPFRIISIEITRFFMFDMPGYPAAVGTCISAEPSDDRTMSCFSGHYTFGKVLQPRATNTHVACIQKM